MKIMLSAFAFLPNAGSEAGVGWRWARELVAAGHSVLVLTDVSRKNAVEAELRTNPIQGLEVVFYRPWWLQSVPLNSTTAQVLYSLWQYGAFFLAKRLRRGGRFDWIVHLTYGVFRHPSLLGLLGVPFVFGPVGGGEDAPVRLKRSLPWRELLKELVRLLLNKSAKLNPVLWLCLWSANTVLVKTEQTRQALPRPFRCKAKIFHEIGIEESFLVKEEMLVGRRADEPLRALYVGRLLGWKGVHLAIRGVDAARRMGVNVELTVVGSGPMEPALHRLVAQLNLGSCVRWHAQVPQRELLEFYRRSHCFLFPSLHDSSGNVVLEAMGSGLPVICLDLGGPASLVTEGCAEVISTGGLGEDEVVTSIGHAIRRLSVDELLRTSKALAGLARARSMSWSGRIESLQEVCFRSVQD